MQVAELFGMLAYSPEKMTKIGVFSTERMFCDLYCFEPGQVQTAHAHAGSDKVYVVLEGRGTFRVDQETRELTAGQAVLAPAGLEHGVTNSGTDKLICLVFMSPLPSK